ncbi:MAG TPA: LPS-assembly protein LptD [Candidatus Hydrogenedentes bacterium]|nr:LPS-assembly protein LptD [Candidatus Hydrogenedentota bacterium]
MTTGRNGFVVVLAIPVLVLGGSAKTARAADQTATQARSAPAEDSSETLDTPATPGAKPTEAAQKPAPAAAPTFEAAETRAPRLSLKPSPVPMLEGPRRTFGEALTEGLDFSDLRTVFEAPDLADESLLDAGAETGYAEWDDAGLHMRGNAWLRIGTTELKAEQIDLDAVEGVRLHARENVIMTQPRSTTIAEALYYIEADEDPAARVAITPAEIDGLEKRPRGKFGGTNIRITGEERELSAAKAEYDLGLEAGQFEDVRGHVGPYYFGAETLTLLGRDHAEADHIWFTTCDEDPPHYRIHLKRAKFEEGEATFGRGTRLELGGVKTPVYWPGWATTGGPGKRVGFDFDSGHRASLGYFVNVGQHYRLTPRSTLGLRLFPTTKEGLGIGLDSEYDYMTAPASPLFRSEGEVRTLVTTEDRGYGELYHRQEIGGNTVLLGQVEHWSDETFYKDFYYEYYRDRGAPRTFANLTHTKPNYLATATVRHRTDNFVTETEHAPEMTYHLLERPVLERLYFTFDAVAGYNEREPAGTHAVRSVNVARVSLDLDFNEAFSVVPFAETEGTWYSEHRDSEASEMRFSSTVGATVQTRLHKTYPGALRFSGFKHVIVPSITYSYRPEPGLSVEDTPRFDAYDNVYGRSRIESKIDNLILGRDAETEEVWQVARLTLYHGNDFWNEIRRSSDYELEVDVRPRPWWGWLMAAEHHSIEEEYDIDAPFFAERFLLEAYERIFDRPPDLETAYQYNARYGDYDRLLTYWYYRDPVREGQLNAHLGFAYTETQDRVFNREVLYGLGYKLGDHWSVAFEHRYDFERDDLYNQKYEIRRHFHCWEAALLMNDREAGWDVGVEFNISAFPGTKVKF